MKKLFFFIIGLFLFMDCSQSQAEIVTIASLEEIVGTLEDLQAGDVVLVDVDDTLMTPRSKLFHDQARLIHFIDELKAEKIPHLPEILGIWRLTRAVQLVNGAWPALLKRLTEKGVIVLGLTQMETGPCGPIPSMEQWRADELKKFGFHFTEKIKGRPSFRLKETSAGIYAAFHQGIIMTGPFKKGEVLAAFLAITQLRPQRIVFFDDRRPHVEDVGRVAGSHNIEYLGVHFREVEKLRASPDPRIVALQKEILIKERKWLEDAEAERRFSQLQIDEG